MKMKKITEKTKVHLEVEMMKNLKEKEATHPQDQAWSPPRDEK